MKRIGLLGGTFNPVHIAHLTMAQTVAEKLGLDKVIFVPAHFPPHKKSTTLTSAEDRFKMVQLAIKSNPQFEISDFEIKRGGKSYTIDTVKHFKKIYPRQTKFFFILGEDSYSHLPEWKSIDQLKKLTAFAVVNRDFSKKKKNRIPCYFIDMPTLEISSSDLRKRIAQGRSVKYLIPGRVLKYIQGHKLYQR